MSRTVGITKVGGSTVVDITDTNSQTEKRIYNKSCNFYTSGSSIVIGKSCPYSEFRFDFSELDDDLSAADINAYALAISASNKGYFNSEIVL